jgi:hypothetical protein
MKLKKNYKFDNNRQIWRIIPTNDGKLVIEERELENKQTFFYTLSLDSGKKILSNFQLEDKFWVGIEAVRNDIIYFHKFAKPDMPKHKGIFAFDINSKNIIWENPELIYQFIFQSKLYANIEKFEGKNYFALDLINGEILDELGDNHQLINELREKSIEDENNAGYLFPEAFEAEQVIDIGAKEFLNSLRNNFVISGNVEYILKNNLLMFSFHETNSKGSLNNLFKAVDLSTGKYILEEVINKETTLFFTDSFFVKDEQLFLLFGKSRLVVYRIVN